MFKNYDLTISPKNANGQKTAKRMLARLVEYVFFKLMKAKGFAPSIIAIGHK